MRTAMMFVASFFRFCSGTSLLAPQQPSMADANADTAEFSTIHLPANRQILRWAG
jgi:hypothetical protein